MRYLPLPALLLVVLCSAALCHGAPSEGAVELVPRVGHSDAVASVAFVADERVLATGSSDGTLKLWSLATGELLRTLPGYEGGRLRASGGLVVAGIEDARLSGADSGGLRFTSQIWEVATGRMLLSADDITLSDDGRLAAVAVHRRDETGSTIRVLEPRTGRVLREVLWRGGAVAYLGLDATGSLLVAGGEERMTIWEVATGRATAVRLPGEINYGSARFDGAGRTLVAPLWDTIALVDVASGKVVASYAGSKLGSAFDGRYLAVAGETGLAIVDVTERREVAIVPVNATTVALAPDRMSVAVSVFGSSTVELYDLPAATRRWALPESYLQGYTPDGSAVAVTRKGTVTLVAAADGRPLVELAHGLDRSYVHESAFSPSGRYFAVAAADDGARAWEVATGALKVAPPVEENWVRAVAVSPDGRLLATTAASEVQLWDLVAGVPAARIALGEEEEVEALSFLPDGRTLAVSGSSGTRLWSIAAARFEETIDSERIAFDPSGKRYVVRAESGVEVRDVETHEIVRAFDDAHDFPAVFARGGKTVWVQLLAGAPSARLVEYDVATGRPLQSVRCPEGSVSAFALSPDGRRLAAAYGSARISVSMGLWDLRGGGPMKRIAPPGTPADVPTFRIPAIVAFTPDGRTLAVGNAGVGIELWDTATVRRRHLLEGHTAIVRAAAMTADGRALVTGSADATTRIWSVAEGRELCLLMTLGGEEWLAASREGLFDGSPGAWSRCAWGAAGDVFDVSPVEIFFNEFFAPGLLADVVAGRALEPARDVGDADRRQPRVSLRVSGGAPEGPVATRTVDLEVEVAAVAAADGREAGTARDVRLFRNGALVQAWRGEVAERGGHAVVRAEKVAVTAGENLFTAYAFNGDNIKSADASLRITGAESLRRTGRTYVLAIGVDAYANPDFNLRYAVADARAFAETLERAPRELGEVVVVPLLDREATASNIRAALARLGGAPVPDGAPPVLATLAPAEPEDTVAIYFAGHGAVVGDRFVLVPHDLGYAGPRASMDADALRAIAEAGISDRDLEIAAERIDASTMLLVVDACQSGKVLDSSERRRGPMNAKGLAQIAYEKGMYVLTAAQSYQAALEAQRLGHGYLTYALVREGIGGRMADGPPPDGKVTIREWLTFAAERVPSMQLERLESERKLEHEVAFVEGEESRAPRERNVQRPRAFMRRDAAGRSPVIARFGDR